MSSRWGGFLALALLVGGCGGSDDHSTSSGSQKPTAGVSQPQPKQPIGAELKRLNAAQAAKSCERIEMLTFSVIRQAEPGAPATKAECQGFAKANRGVKVTVFDKSAAYGTAALTEGPPTRAGQKGIVTEAVWALDGDGRYRFTRISGQGSAQIGTQPRAGAKIGPNAQAFVEAVRHHDCAQLTSVLNPSGRLYAGGRDKLARCKVVLSGKFFEPAIRNSPGARAVKLGATRSFAFYGVSTKTGYFTLILRTPPDGNESEMTVMDVLPNTPVKLAKP